MRDVYCTFVFRELELIEGQGLSSSVGYIVDGMLESLCIGFPYKERVLQGNAGQ